MVYGQEEKIKVQYERELKNLIYNAILQSSGQETTCVYTAYERTSRFVRCILHTIMCDQEHIDGDIKIFEKILSSYRDAITYTSQKEIIKDERQLLKSGQIKQAELVIRRTYRIVISQKYAQHIYNDVFGARENSFRYKLLHEHHHILEQIIQKSHLSEKSVVTTSGQVYHILGCFCVKFDCVQVNIRDWWDEFNTISTGYYEFGMKNLSSIMQYYGMALALIDVLRRTIWMDKKVDIKITYHWDPDNHNPNYREYIQVSYDFGRKAKTNAPILKDW